MLAHWIIARESKHAHIVYSIRDHRIERYIRTLEYAHMLYLVRDHMMKEDALDHFWCVEHGDILEHWGMLI